MEPRQFQLIPSIPVLVVMATPVLVAFAIGENVHPRRDRLAALVASLQLALPLMLFHWFVSAHAAGWSWPEPLVEPLMVLPFLVAMIVPFVVHRVAFFAVCCGLASCALWILCTVGIAFMGGS